MRATVKKKVVVVIEMRPVPVSQQNTLRFGRCHSISFWIMRFENENEKSICFCYLSHKNTFDIVEVENTIR